MKVAFSGSDTLILQNRTITDLADGQCVNLEFPDDSVVAKTGKNGNTIYTYNFAGNRATVTVRTLRGSDDDKFLNSIFNLMKTNPAAFILLDGEFIKKIGDGKGNIKRDTYILGGGVPTRGVNAEDSAEGSTEAAVAVYNFAFATASRSIG